METVEVLVRLPETEYLFIKTMIENGYEPPSSYYYNIASGIVLPKGHGKLFDSNVLWNAYQDLGQDFYEAFDFAETNAVIEADEDGE